MDNLLYMLIDLLSKNDDNIVLCAAGILSNLTCNNAKNKVVSYSHSAIDYVIKTTILCIIASGYISYIYNFL